MALPEASNLNIGAVEDAESGDGETYNDIVIVESCRSVDLCAERVQNGNGRVYILGLAVADAGDTAVHASYEVHLPLNMKDSPLGIADTPLSSRSMDARPPRLRWMVGSFM